MQNEEPNKKQHEWGAAPASGCFLCSDKDMRLKRVARAADLEVKVRSGTATSITHRSDGLT